MPGGWTGLEFAVIHEGSAENQPPRVFYKKASSATGITPTMYTGLNPKNQEGDRGIGGMIG